VRDFTASSELHVRDLLVCLHDFVPHLHHQLKRQIGLFHRNHGAVQIGAFPVEQLGHLRGGIALRALGLVDRLLQGLEKFAALGGARGCGAMSAGRMRIDGIELFMAEPLLHFHRGFIMAAPPPGRWRR